MSLSRGRGALSIILRPVGRRLAHTSRILEEPLLEKPIWKGAGAFAAALVLGNGVVCCEAGARRREVTGGRRRTDILKEKITAMIDVDGDGSLTQREVEVFFDKIDTSKDGAISYDEFYNFLIRSGMPTKDRLAVKELFDMADIDGSGEITKDELYNVFGRVVRRPTEVLRYEIASKFIDADGDGNLSNEELVSFFEELDVNKDGTLTCSELYQGLVRKGMTGKNHKVIAAFFEEMDVNSLGYVTKMDFCRMLRGEVRTAAERLKDKICKIIGIDDEDYQPAQIEAFFAKVDVDHDGAVTFDELYKYLVSKGCSPSDRQTIKDVFNEIDADGSGDISIGEFSSMMGFQVRSRAAIVREKIARLMDVDDDGDISESELANFFNRVDVDHSGSISFAELYKHLLETGRFTAADQQTIKEVFQDMDSNKTGEITLRDVCRMYRRTSTEVWKETLISKMDSDGAGKISVDKINSFFSKIDTNNDGSITFEELSAFVQQETEASADTMNQVKDLFNELDEDKSGSITKEEIFYALQECPPRYPIKAECKVGNLTADGCKGLVTFTQTSASSCKVEWQLERCGKKGMHGFHIHEKADFSHGSVSAGGIYNPFKKSHGGPSEDWRNIGDLGNVTMDQNGNSKGHMTDRLIKLYGETSIIGRSVVVSEDADDLGKGNHASSRINGNSGAGLACGAISLK